MADMIPVIAKKHQSCIHLHLKHLQQLPDLYFFPFVQPHRKAVCQDKFRLPQGSPGQLATAKFCRGQFLRGSSGRNLHAEGFHGLLRPTQCRTSPLSAKKKRQRRILPHGKSRKKSWMGAKQHHIFPAKMSAFLRLHPCIILTSKAYTPLLRNRPAGQDIRKQRLSAPGIPQDLHRLPRRDTQVQSVQSPVIRRKPFDNAFHRDFHADFPADFRMDFFLIKIRLFFLRFFRNHS